MTAKSLRLVLVVAALSLPALVTAEASAQCCGNTGAHTAYYGGYTANYGGYTANYGGWYPGYWMDRVRTRLWGSPNTYVAAYTPHTVGYAGYATSYATYASGASCSSCSPCGTGTTCGYAPCSTCVQQVTMSPVCGCESCPTGCSTGCSSCSGSTVVQAGYVQQAQPGCSTCGANAHPQGTTMVVQPPANGHAPQQVLQAPAAQQQAPPPATGSEQPPQLGPAEGQPEQTYKEQKPTNGIEQSTQPNTGLQPTPGDDTTTPGANGESKDPSTYFEAPKLFNPKDRTAGRSIAPVRTALYEQPASMHQISAQRTVITAQQAQQDAAGWSSASN